MTVDPITLEGKSVLSFVDDIYEDLELWYPKMRLIAAGAKFITAGPEAGVKYLGKHGYPCVSDVAIANCQSSNFNALLLPGGFMPDKLRRDAKVKSLIQEFDAQGKCIAAICHGGWMAISAGVYKGVRVTGSLGIKDDLENAGAIWEDAPVVVDRHFVSSRKPDDLPLFGEAMVRLISQLGR
jgi:protease I